MTSRDHCLQDQQVDEQRVGRLKQAWDLGA